MIKKKDKMTTLEQCLKSELYRFCNSTNGQTCENMGYSVLVHKTENHVAEDDRNVYICSDNDEVWAERGLKRLISKTGWDDWDNYYILTQTQYNIWAE